MTPDDLRHQLRAAWPRLRPYLRPVLAWTIRTFHRAPAWRVRWLGRLTPASRRYGFDRGKPIDRWYVEHFLRRHAGNAGYGGGDFRGRVMEVGGDEYARLFGGRGVGGAAPAGVAGGVTSVDIFDLPGGHPQATVVGDLTRPREVPADAFDCIICTQTLLVIYDFRAALRSLHRMLAPGGVLFVTLPGIARSAQPDVDLWGDYWRFTTGSTRRLLEELFPAENVKVEAYGNVLSATAALYGLAAQELRKADLELRDPDFEVIVGGRAVKPAAP
jgi:SAM-dependent methyltransferase